jgi:hypothetical protein
MVNLKLTTKPVAVPVSPLRILQRATYIQFRLQCSHPRYLLAPSLPARDIRLCNKLRPVAVPVSPLHASARKSCNASRYSHHHHCLLGSLQRVVSNVSGSTCSRYSPSSECGYITTAHGIGDACITLLRKSLYRSLNTFLQGNQHLIGKNQLIRRC